jgi:hypothetical protein
LIRLTDEQRAVVEHQGDARCNSCAGSGKTQTLLVYAKARPKANILYIAYNKAVKDSAVRKFKKSGVENVTVETAHSMAYKEIMQEGGFTLNPQGNLRIHDVMEYCGIQYQSDGTGLVLAKHVMDCLSSFCNSDKEKIHHLEYIGGAAEASRRFAARHLDVIHGHAKSLFYGMYDGDIPMTHDVYLKIYQLQHPRLPYTHLLFDEGQDANPCMLDIFRKQSATKIIVGDNFQSIYSFNGAVNSLEILNYPLFRLTNSFRFGKSVANLAMTALKLKLFLGESLNGFVVNGRGETPAVAKTTGIIARSNLGLLQKAIEVMCDDGHKAAFEGGLRNYSCMSGGGGLFDVLNLYLGKEERIKDDFYKSFKAYDALVKYQEDTGDRNIGMMITVVQHYGGALFPLLKKIKEQQEPRASAEIVFSSVHRAKGQEYDQVILANDFMHGKKLLKVLGGGGRKNREGNQPDLQELSEELNILYVGLTRTRGEIKIPFEILPEDLSLPGEN